MSEKTYSIYARIKRITQSAVLVNDGNIDIWIPASLIENYVELFEGRDMLIEVAEWFLHKEGLI